MRILVADDSKTNLIILTNALVKMGHDVIAAYSGEQAITLFSKQRPDLIILDVVMETMDGFECAKKIRELNSEDWIPIIFLSGAVNDENISKGINAGGDDYLTKPFSEITLAAKIKAMQRISDMRQKLFDATQKLSVLSSVDPVTCVFNRLEFDKRIMERIEHTHDHAQMMALLYIDIDHFKKINDNLGHHIGDTVLREAARRISACTRKDDIVARLGGDEFAIILTNMTNMNTANLVAEKIIDALKPPFKISIHDIHISCSIGIACYPSAETTLETLVQKADIAMYRAKELGRNNYQLYTTALNNKYCQRIKLENDFKKSVENQELFVAYQPIFDLQSKQLCGVEALLRWKHPQLGFIQPEVFIPLAEECGFMTLIGQEILEKACAQGALWYAQGHKRIKLMVNISSRQLLQKDLPSFITRILHRTKLPPHLLEIELAENIIMTHVIHSEKMIRNIADLGISISIDDFGTGCSCLAYLKQLPIKSFKIDKSFIKNIEANTQNLTIMKALIALGLNLDLNVIAQGIETEKQYQLLLKAHCPQGQGFYFRKPLSAAELNQFLNGEEKITT